MSILFNKCKRLLNEEIGQIIIISQILLVFGSLVMLPLLDFMSTGLRSGERYEGKMLEIYAVDAGVEDAMQKIKKLIAPLDTMEVHDLNSYTIDSVNGNPVDVTIMKLSLLEGLLGDDEFKIGQPHESWINYELPEDSIIRNPGEDWVEYKCLLKFHYDGVGTRQVETAGVYFSPYPMEVIEGPYDEQVSGVMTFEDLESRQLKIAAGGFAFIYRWLDNSGPIFTKTNKNGSISLRFKVYDADWQYGSTFVWATFKEQDVSFVTTAEMTKWIVSATAGGTVVKSEILRDNGQVNILSWEINPLENQE